MWPTTVYSSPVLEYNFEVLRVSTSFCCHFILPLHYIYLRTVVITSLLCRYRLFSVDWTLLVTCKTVLWMGHWVKPERWLQSGKRMLHHSQHILNECILTAVGHKKHRYTHNQKKKIRILTLINQADDWPVPILLIMPYACKLPWTASCWGLPGMSVRFSCFSTASSSARSSLSVYTHTTLL